MMSRFFSRFLLPAILFFGFHLSPAQDFLSPQQAFIPHAQAIDAQTVAINFSIAKGYYLYRDKFKFEAGAGVVPGQAILPKGQEKDDENFGKVEVYHDQVEIRLPVERLSSGPLSFDLKVTAQGCADGGLCYPPQLRRFKIDLPQAADPAPAAKTPLPSPPAATSPPDESGKVALSLHQNGFWTNILLFFAAGLGLAFTPCVFPMIPILSGIIAGQKTRASRGRAFALSVMYVLGMAITYAVAGVIAGFTGTLVSGLMQNGWVLSIFALIFVALAFSMFGFYPLQLPSVLQSRLTAEAGHFANGRGPGVFIMGGLSALIVGPCVLPFLAGALVYIGQTGNAFLGGTALFALALGQGLPLILVGVFTGAMLPHAGAWMETVSRAFGVVLLGIALWIVSPLLSPSLVLAGWAALFIIPAIFLHALDPLPPAAKRGQRFMKGIGLILLLVGAALLAGALAGSRDPLRPLAGLFGKAENAASPLPFERVATLPELEVRLQKARGPVMLDFTADWCTDCKRMDRETFSSPEIRTRLTGFTLLRADITASSEADRQILRRFNLFGPPAILFFNAGGREISRLTGYKDAAALGRAFEDVKPSLTFPYRNG